MGYSNARRGSCARCVCWLVVFLVARPAVAQVAGPGGADRPELVSRVYDVTDFLVEIPNHRDDSSIVPPTRIGGRARGGESGGSGGGGGGGGLFGGGGGGGGQPQQPRQAELRSEEHTSEL